MGHTKTCEYQVPDYCFYRLNMVIEERWSILNTKEPQPIHSYFAEYNPLGILNLFFYIQSNNISKEMLFWC